VFRGFSQGTVERGKAKFKMLWHRDRFFELVFDSKKKTLSFPVVLPDVARNAAIYREFGRFVESQSSPKIPAHRRIERKKVRMRASYRAGNVALTATVAGSDYEYAVRKLVHLVHETYLVFLVEGKHYEYLVETFDLDPDHL
jgi:hypothetical protein